MKIKTLLISLLVLGFLLIPNTVNAVEVFTKQELFFEDPQAGNVIPSTAKLILSNDISEVTLDNVELYWQRYDAANDIWLDLTENQTTFEADTKYYFEISRDPFQALLSEKGYEVTNDAEFYTNGILISSYTQFREQAVYINGFEAGEIIVDIPIVQGTFPETAKFLFETEDGIVEFEIDIMVWVDISDQDTPIYPGDIVTKAGANYIFNYESTEELAKYLIKTDYRTETIVNSSNNMFVVSLPSGTTFSITNNITNANSSNTETTIEPNTEYKTTITAVDGYTLPEKVKVSINNYVLSETSYSYDNTTGELTIPAERVTGNITISGNAVELPKYKVVFDANEGLFSENKTTITIEEWEIGDEENIEKPTREGYEFLGFYTEKTNGTSLEMYLAESGIDQDITFYAQWKKIESSSENNNPNDNNETQTTPPEDSSTGNSSSNVSNPQTGDNIILFVSILLISIMGVVITTKIKNKIER